MGHRNRGPSKIRYGWYRDKETRTRRHETPWKIETGAPVRLYVVGIDTRRQGTGRHVGSGNRGQVRLCMEGIETMRQGLEDMRSRETKEQGPQ